MASKISALDTQPVQIAAGSAVKRTPDAVSGRPENTASTAEVHITAAARRLASLEQTLKDQPEVDDKRVNTVRSAIEGGTYKISPDRISDRLVSLERSLASARKPEK